MDDAGVVMEKGLPDPQLQEIVSVLPLEIFNVIMFMKIVAIAELTVIGKFVVELPVLPKVDFCLHAFPERSILEMAALPVFVPYVNLPPVISCPDGRSVIVAGIFGDAVPY
jgi:hypothetical protein